MKSGPIRVYKDGEVLPVPFAFLPDTCDALVENGVLGIATDPDFAAHPYVYVFQTYVPEAGGNAVAGDCTELDCPFAVESNADGTTRVVNAAEGPKAFGNCRQRVVRYDASQDAAASSDSFEVVIDDLPGATWTHNGGGLAFRKDGTLLVGLGDCTTPPMAGDFSNEVGCVLRVDRHTGAAPADNPFVDPNDGIPDTIWACGIRQGFGLAVHGATGELYQAENGPSWGDELNWIPKGAHMGWDIGAGFLGQDGLVDPVQAWTPTIAPTKLTVYTGALMPELYGDILLVSWKQSSIRRIELADPEGAPNALGRELMLLPYAGKPVPVAQDPSGQIFYADFLSGTLSRLDPISPCEAPQAAIQTDPVTTTGAVPFLVTLDGSGSYAQPPATQIVAWSWYFGHDEGTKSGPVVAHHFTHIRDHWITLTVTDDLGRIGHAFQKITVTPGEGDSIPTAHITWADPTTGAAPFQVALRGHGHDHEGQLARLEWDFGDGSDVVTEEPATSDVDYWAGHLYTDPGSYEARLTAFDAAGQSFYTVVGIEVLDVGP
jgi:hypothetical protein